MIKNKDSNKKILIAEDERAMLRALTDTFENEGFNVFGAEDGEKGLKIAFKEHPDVILIDLLMPKMDGISMLKKIREDEWGKDVPVIILTNLSDVDKIAETVENGISHYLVKTEWSLEEIVKKVKKLLKE